MHIDNGIKARLRRQMSNGELVLFTGAGFSRGAVSTSGLTIPGVWELKRDLWRLAFPGRAAELEGETLADIYGVALSRARGAVERLLKESFTVDALRSPERYRRWFELPWFRQYTLNIDNLDDAIGSKYTLPRHIKSLSAGSNSIEQGSALLSVHLNGRLVDFPNLTFSTSEYAKRLTSAEVWYHQLVSDLMTHPIVFVGTTLDEAGLWQHIELRRQRGESTIEMRPPSYLVAPELSTARAALLKSGYNIDWVECSEEVFFEEVLKDATVEAQLGHQKLKARYATSSPPVVLRTIQDDSVSRPPADLTAYLMGREPAWADLTDGYAITRDFEAALFNSAVVAEGGGILITGTASSGKSTIAMRLLLSCQAEGFDVRILDAPAGDLSPGTVAAAIRRSHAQVVLIDDVDIFGDKLLPLLQNLSEVTPRPYVIGTLRSSKLQGMQIREELREIDVTEFSVPSLANADIDALLSALASANRLGRLAGEPPAVRRKVLRDYCGRQLVVGMFEATSGERFHDKIISECEDLSGTSRLTYGMIALATCERQFLLKDEVELALALTGSSITNADLNRIEELVARGLLLQNGRELRLRHRWIAETTLEFFSSNGLIASPLRGLLSSLAARVDPQVRKSGRESRLLRRLMNHDHLLRVVGDVGSVREIYSFVEERLAGNYHYWLQRGSLEVEAGDLSLAENFLNAAISLAPQPDFRVTTEYAYLLLKKAAKAPTAPMVDQWADEAFRNLEAVIANRGKEDRYPFHVYGSQGLSYARRAVMTPEARRILLIRLRDAVAQGASLHPRALDLRQLHQDLIAEVLNLATV